MKKSCEKFERMICLHSELTNAEQRELEAHLQQCEACNQQMQQMQSLAAAIHQAAQAKAVPGNQAQLTHRIMQAIHSPAPTTTTWKTLADKFFNAPLLRYSMATLSLLLVIQFVREVENPIISEITYTRQQEIYSTKKGKLDTNTFLKNILTTRQHEISQKRISIIQCIKTNTCDQISYFKTRKSYVYNQ